LNIHVHDVHLFGASLFGGSPFLISKGGLKVKILNRLGDVRQNEEEQIPKEVFRYLEQEWIQMYEAFSESGPVDEFQMSKHCQMVLVVSSNDDFTMIGLPGSLPKCFVEYVDLVTIGESLLMYRTFIMQDNEAGIMLYSIVGTLEDDTECFLAEQAELNNR
jgi:hypothetical protein